MAEPLENVIAGYGRREDEGTDKRVKHFAYGSLFVLNDWSAFDGSGPGGGVVPPAGGGSGRSGAISVPEIPETLLDSLQQAVNELGADDMAPLLKKLEGGKKLSPLEFRSLLDYVEEELADSQAAERYSPKEIRLLKNFYNRLIGLGN
jgi:hypothetical protein